MKTVIPDLSHYNEKIDWDKAKDQCPFVILRASCGTGTDNRYSEYVSECWKRAIPYHAYHYLKATNTEAAIAEASVFHAATASSKPLFYVVDCEYKGITDAEVAFPGLAKGVVDTFVYELKRLAGDIRVAIYIGHNCYKKWKLNYDEFEYVWIPRYGEDDGVPHTPPDFPCDIWQYTSKGQVDFVSDNTDLNKLMGTKPLEFFTGADGEFTNLKLAQWCLDVYERGWRYWYGTCGYECSKSLYESKKKQYPDHYTSSRTTGYMNDISDDAMCADCVGMIKAFFWMNGDIDNTENKYKSNNCPDRSANGMFEQCEVTGPINTMPNIPGLVVHKNKHIGVHIGDNIIVEMRGYAADCVKAHVTDNNWEEWGMLPDSMLTYVGNMLETPTYKLGDRVLRKGDKGSDVTELQTALVYLNYDLGDYGEAQNGVDGSFGSLTEIAVRDLQSKYSLKVDGEFGPQSYKALMDMLAQEDVPDEDTPDGGSEPVYILVLTGSKEELESIQADHGGELLSLEECQEISV